MLSTAAAAAAFRPLLILGCSLLPLATAGWVVRPAPLAQDPTQKPGIPADGQPATTSASGLITSVLAPGDGSGESPRRGDLVTVRYSGFLTDGTPFDSSGLGTAEFRVGQVVPGWNEALEGMERGGRVKLTLPPELGYGERGSGATIPANATLIFDIELLDFERGPKLPTFMALPAEATTLESGVRYQLVQAGSGEPALANEPYKLAFTFYNVAGVPIDSGLWGNGPLIADQNRVQFPFLKELHAELKLGAKLWVQVPPASSFGDITLPGVSPGDPTVWSLEVLAIVRNPVLPAYQPMDPALAVESPSGFKYQVVQPGEGEPCGQEGTFKLQYVIYAPDGQVVDSSLNRGSGALVGTVDQMRLAMLQELPPLMAPGAVYLCDVPVTEVFPQRCPPPLVGQPNCSWRLELERVLVPLPEPEFKRSAEGDFEVTKSGLQVEWLRRGSGPTARKDQRAVVNYAGWLTDGTPFDSSFGRGDTSTFPIDQVVPGWTEGLQLMNVGSIVRLTVPYQLAYGESGRGTIPPKADLIFYVELLGLEE